jgi:hypothetical protein
MGKSLDDLANIDEVDLLVGTMDVRLRSANTQSNDLGSWVFALKLFKEGNGSTLTKGSDLLSLEVLLGCLLEAILQPAFKLFLLPSTAGVATLNGNLCIVGNIGCELLSHYLVCLVSIKDWAKSHGTSASS